MLTAMLQYAPEMVALGLPNPTLLGLDLLRNRYNPCTALIYIVIVLILPHSPHQKTNELTLLPP